MIHCLQKIFNEKFQKLTINWTTFTVRLIMRKWVHYEKSNCTFDQQSCDTRAMKGKCNILNTKLLKIINTFKKRQTTKPSQGEEAMHDDLFSMEISRMQSVSLSLFDRRHNIAWHNDWRWNISAIAAHDINHWRCLCGEDAARRKRLCMIYFYVLW